MGASVEESLVLGSCWRLSEPGFGVGKAAGLVLMLFLSWGNFLSLFWDEDGGTLRWCWGNAPGQTQP